MSRLQPQSSGNRAFFDRADTEFTSRGTQRVR